ncbi:hypothetical protein [Chryseobacterium sp. R2A-55]|uniref:hypothetical protein n=1 Tax=Chryseobacterium sp. R2A-55 TaxID=2744445 RepID=UPI001F242D14|nr:hypothetical protein [Chryseobacterium sp. R2A-55]
MKSYKTLIKVALTIISMVISGGIIGLMMESQTFGKFIVVAIQMIILKLIWSKSKDEPVLTSVNPVIKKKENVNNTGDIVNKTGGTNPTIYNAGHNSQNNQSATWLKSGQPEDTHPKKSREFNSDNPYSKN